MPATITALVATAILYGVPVAADWASLGDGVGTGLCPQGGNVLAPVFNDESWDGICASLVEDGCTDNKHILAQGDAGSSGFRRNEDLDCADNAPAGHLTCTNTFRDGYGRCGSSFSPHEQPSCGVQVFNADGVVVGNMVFVGGCLPPITPLKGWT
ncbi:hypothetical protein FCULG_00008977 [Fusarium culmorum]|uniref:Secreted protein n=1 Tax=Fusarium culmorum TaxID=5516 RepID=A0A2T4H213_FUSCU|nr:hypothetical protein FCULG_00008977 [Fusarium culmorum]